MSVKLRLTRVGKKKNPMYRVVVADERSPRDGKFIEIIGQYQPLAEPSMINIKDDRALYWLSEGAQPSETVQKILSISGIWEQYEKSRPKKSLEKAAKRNKAIETGRKKSQDAHIAKKAPQEPESTEQSEEASESTES
ncbi:MAG: 30S ribosomal protein S16 [Acidimicrobiia bacterium]